MKIKIYGKPNCSFCERAKMLCRIRGLAYEYTDITTDALVMQEFQVRTSHAKTVPQIFVDEILVGGFEQFNAFLSKKA